MEQTASKIIDSRKARFSSAVWFDSIDKHRITIAGARGAGSWLTLYLSRIGYKIELIDFDKVEIHNLGGQLFGMQNLNNTKVSSVHSIVRQLGCNNPMIARTLRFEEVTMDTNTNIFISAVDTVSARRDVIQAFRDCGKPNKLYIETRLSAEMFQLYIFTEKSTQQELLEYNQNLLELNNLPDDACTFKQTSHIASMLGSTVTSIITNWCSNIELDADIKTVPKFVEFNEGLLLLTVN